MPAHRPDHRHLPILVVDDNPQDRFLAQEVFSELGIPNAVHFASDGRQCLDYLHRRGDFRELCGTPLPALILLDLNMPRMDGFEALEQMRADPERRHLPVVVMTTSSNSDDVRRCYDLGASSYVVKPSALDGMLSLIQSLHDYWFGPVRLPPSHVC